LKTKSIKNIKDGYFLKNSSLKLKIFFQLTLKSAARIWEEGNFTNEG